MGSKFMTKYKIEICTDNIESAIYAQNAGADRIELCNNLPEGGTTPGSGLIRSARENLSIGLHVIIRPRGGDFLYSVIEYDIMRREIDVCRECGADGVVLGILEPGGAIDIDRTATLIEYARPMSVTFHRAFDLCIDPFKGLEAVIDSGADRLLTSGHRNNAYEGIPLIKDLIKQAKNRIIIMPGAGINESNITDIARVTGAKEFHFTGRKVIESGMIFRREDILMGAANDTSEYSRKVVNPEMIRRIINNLKLI
jgi:copper homeostasis protein